MNETDLAVLDRLISMYEISYRYDNVTQASYFSKKIKALLEDK